MRINIQSTCCELTTPLAEYIEHRVNETLRGASRQVTAVTVRVADINGARDGADKSCRIAMCFRGLSTAMASAVDADMYVAIDRAAERLARVVSERTRCLAGKPPMAHAGNQRGRHS